MFSVCFFKILRFLPILLLPLAAWLMPHITQGHQLDTSPEKVNLALRRTADGVLRASGDSTSRIPAIEQYALNVWRIRMEQPFRYEYLPEQLQSSLDLHGIRQPYEVAVRRCVDATIDLGYHQLDYTENDVVPCGGREMPEGCHFIEIRFLGNEGKTPLERRGIGALLLIMGGLTGYWYFRRKKQKPDAGSATLQTDWLDFGNSRLDVTGQILLSGSIRQNLTFRETKLLKLFVTNPDQLLERDFILRQVWEDEGILVGRSVDVFVSRLRKKLAADSSVGIVAVHGVGYRLETGKEG